MSSTCPSHAIDISSSSDLFGEGEEKVNLSWFNSQAQISTYVAKFWSRDSRFKVRAYLIALNKWGISPTTLSAGLTSFNFDFEKL